MITLKEGCPMVVYNRSRKGWLKVVLFVVIFALGMTLTFTGVDGADNGNSNRTENLCDKY